MESPLRVVGRYALHGEIASGGMATVYLGRLQGPVGFSRTVAIKRLHPQFAKDPEFVSMFLDEARLAARVRHPNVVSTLDVVAQDGELILVLEFVLGETLARLVRAAQNANVAVPPNVAVGIATGLLYGLHAAHEATSESGEALHIVHRDVSPQNVIVGTDGIARVLDFGIAKAVGRVHQTREGVLKGKVAYMPPEQLKGGTIDRRVDLYAAAVVLWETLAGATLFEGENEWQIANRVMEGVTTPPSAHAKGIPRALDEAILRGLAKKADERFATALDMAGALERAMTPASPREIGAWLASVAGHSLENRARQVADVESARGAMVALPASIPEPPRRVSRNETKSSHTRRIADLDDGPTQSLDDRAADDVLGPPRRADTAITGAATFAASDTPTPTTAKPEAETSAALAVFPEPPRPKTSPRTWLVATLAIAALTVAFGLGALVSRPAVTNDTHANAPLATSPPVVAASSDVTTATSAPTTLSVAPIASPPPPASSPPPANVTSEPTTPHAHPSKAATSRKSGCNPPYVVDERGIKHLKPECL